MNELRVTLIDDDPIFHLIFDKMVHKYLARPASVQKLENGLDAIEHFRLHQNEEDKLPHMLFIDLNMPFMTGWELMDAFIEERIEFINRIPVYILSSSNSLLDRKCLEHYSFISGFLCKPLTKEQLIEIFERKVGKNDSK